MIFTLRFTLTLTLTLARNPATRDSLSQEPL